MIHTLMLLVAGLLAWVYRFRWQPNPTHTWAQRWQSALSALVLPVLITLVTAISILWMGPRGEMAGPVLGKLSYAASLGVLLYAGSLCLKLTGEGWRSVQWIRHCPSSQDHSEFQGRIIPTPALFAAQVGFWSPELVVSQGLLDRMDPEHLTAVLAHEQAHLYFRDTYWFFWLGWIRTLAGWLPNSQVLWDELLMLREVRADGRAAEQVDPLVLAESLLMVVQDRAGWQFGLECAATVVPTEDDGLSDPSKLARRIDALLTDPGCDYQPLSWWWLRWSAALLPLVVVPFHG